MSIEHGNALPETRPAVLLVRLYKTARRLHEQAMEFAAWQAEEDYEKMIKQMNADYSGDEP